MVGCVIWCPWRVIKEWDKCGWEETRCTAGVEYRKDRLESKVGDTLDRVGESS